jgi:surface antigen
MIMHKAKPIIIFSAILMVFFHQTVSSYNLGFLRHSPARHFSEQDWEMANAAIGKALHEKKDGETVSWENPQTKSSGTVTPIMTETEADMTCRQLKIENRARGMSGNVIYRFCREPDGKWAVQSGASAKPEDDKTRQSE